MQIMQIIQVIQIIQIRYIYALKDLDHELKWEEITQIIHIICPILVVVAVVFTLNRSFYPTTSAHPVSVLILPS